MSTELFAVAAAVAVAVSCCSMAAWLQLWQRSMFCGKGKGRGKCFVMWHASSHPWPYACEAASHSTVQHLGARSSGSSAVQALQQIPIFLPTLHPVQHPADAVTVKLSQGQDMDVASFYQGLSWSTYTVGAVLSAYTTGVLLELSGPRAVFLSAAGCLALDSCCALLISERKETPKQVLVSRSQSSQSSRSQSQQLGVGDMNGPGAQFEVAAPGSAQRGSSRKPGVGRMREGSSGGRGGWWAALGQGPVMGLLRQVWHTVQQPHIRGPAVFIFVWQSTPAPTTAMFYFQVGQWLQACIWFHLL